MDVPLEKLLEKTGSLYKLANLAAKRTLQLDQGAAPLVKDEQPHKPSIIALEEILEGKVTYEQEKS
jgi:DNA-directed RNA polymerase omega subunit